MCVFKVSVKWKHKRNYSRNKIRKINESSHTLYIEDLYVKQSSEIIAYFFALFFSSLIENQYLNSNAKNFGETYQCTGDESFMKILNDLKLSQKRDPQEFIRIEWLSIMTEETWR